MCHSAIVDFLLMIVPTRREDLSQTFTLFTLANSPILSQNTSTLFSFR